MTRASRRIPGTAWIAELIEAAGRVFAFRTGSAAPTRPSPKRGSRPMQRKIAEVHSLAGSGVARCEIARRTGLSQDIVAMLLNLSLSDAAETAASGTFFRILQSRIAA